MEPLLFALHARKFLATLKGGIIIGNKTLAKLMAKEGLPWHPDPFGTGRRVFLESEIRAWWLSKLSVTPRPMAGPGRPRLMGPRIKQKVPAATGTY